MMMNKFLSYCCCCCCCCKNEYKPLSCVIDNNRTLDTDGEWVLSIFDANSSSNSSSSQEDKNDSIPTLDMYTDVEDSVEDEEYYKQYTPNIHLLEIHDETGITKSLATCLNHLDNARRRVNECFEAMTRNDYTEILVAYMLALEYCPSIYKAKRSIIREYEHFKHIYSGFDTDERASIYAHNRWREANTHKLSIEKRKIAYKLAIMSIDDVNIRRKWKQEYNTFFKYNQ